MDAEKIRDALNSFEDDKFTDAKDILSTEIRRTKDEFLKNKLKLKDWSSITDTDTEGE